MSNKIIHQLRSINTRSIYSVLLLVVIGGLVAPAIIGSYLMIGIREQKVAHTALQETLQRDADILSLGLQEPLWVLNPQAASALVESLMRDPAVLRVQVLDQMAQPFIVTSSAVRPTGKIYRAERDIMLHGQRIGHLLVEMDDAKSNQELRAKQFSYVFVLAAQLAVSLLLIILFLNGRLLLPLRKLMSFSDRLSRGDFDTRLEPLRSDELGRLGEQLEHMRIAIKQLFDDVGRREERFRTIVTQVPGAVFRYTQDGRIEFISNTIESICGYPAEKFLAGGTREWISLIAIADRKRVLRHVSEGNRTRVPYEIEYRIRAASGAECWVSENAQPGGNGHENAQWVDGILVDISERKRNEMRIEALLAEQAVILDNVLVSVMFVQRRIVMSANRRFDNMFGYDKNEIVGRSVGLLYATEASFNSIGENAKYSTNGATVQHFGGI
ncbi:MAG: PAS domain S-box protein [Pseudomonadota bacterium]